MSFVNCPHCDICIDVIALNCRIFRCGVYKNNCKQIDPHLPKTECDRLSKENLIYGCSKPFIVDLIDGKYISKICDYI